MADSSIKDQIQFETVSLVLSLFRSAISVVADLVVLLIHT